MNETTNPSAYPTPQINTPDAVKHPITSPIRISSAPALTIEISVRTTENPWSKPTSVLLHPL